MPVSGGAADKLGNRYETLWAIDQLLRIVEGVARHLILEPLNTDESKGIEFVVDNTDGTTDYWSVKRQTAKSDGWKLSLLGAKDAGGRSILGDLLGHVERNPSHHGVFASTLAARHFEELREHAASKDLLAARLDRSVELTSEFRQHLLPLCGGDSERVRAFLLRTRTHAADEAQLRSRVDFAIRHLLFASNGTTLDVAAVRGWLADFLLDNIHRPLDREAILAALKIHAVSLREWGLDKSVQDRIDGLCMAYTAPLQSQRINGTLLTLLGSDALIGADGNIGHHKVLVVGGAGGGKSTILASCVERLRGHRVPVLVVRFDHLPEGILTTTELGRKLLLPESPALVLAGIAAGRPSVLVIDQLDAISIVSGRRAELWALFEQLRGETERFPGMSLIVGCREFDLEHDYRMRTMKTTASGFSVVHLKPLSIDQIESALRDAGTDPTAVQSTLKPILAVPLHLSMFLRLDPMDRVSVHSRDELFDAFWTEGERRTDQRLGRKSAWTRVIDNLVTWLSENQQLSAPPYVLDEFSEDAAAMGSEHVVILADRRYRFFHESFFDYAFARRFAAKGGRLVDLLLGGEQHLFRRAQVRQVLAYLRAQDWPRYLEELQWVLANAAVRFHIKRLLFQWLSSLPDPQRAEWDVLQGLVGTTGELRSHIYDVVKSSSAWFDVLHAAGFLDAALSSGDRAREQEIVWLLGLHPTLETRSAHVAELLQKHRKPGEPWNQYLRHVCRHGDVYHSREIFDLFLSLLDDGTLDGLRPGFAVNDDWWSVFYSMAAKRPDLACEAIGRWLARTLLAWRRKPRDLSNSAEGNTWTQGSLAAYFAHDGDGSHVLRDAAKAPLSYVEHILPHVAEIVNDTSTECRDRLDIDPLWSCRAFGDKGHQTHDALLACLAGSLATLAATAPPDLDRLIAPYQDRPHDTIAYLVLRAWTAAPDVYADRLADYLAADVRRLKIGYAIWGTGGGSAANYVSSCAVKAASKKCSPDRLAALEGAILGFTDRWEAEQPQARGRTQLELLESLEPARLSAAGRAKLDELRHKFPTAKHDRPRASKIVRIESPVPRDAQDRMSDEHWLGAMRKYAGVHHRQNREMMRSGGELELAQSLEEQTKVSPSRFARLAEQMPNDLPATYFDAIIRGVTSGGRAGTPGVLPTIAFDQVVSFVRRVHSLPGRPCGRWLASLIGEWVGCDWPDDLIEAMAWYAINDPDPQGEPPEAAADSRQRSDETSLLMQGINSTRGASAHAIARLLFDDPKRFEGLRSAIDSLANDRSIAVRSCALDALLAAQNVNVYEAIAWFGDCVGTDPRLLQMPATERFVYYAAHSDYAAMRPTLDEMLRSTAPGAVEAGARNVCLLAFDVEAATADAERVRTGTPTMRKAAVDIYSTNVANDEVGATCRRLVKPFFADPDESIRKTAASAFHHLARMATADQADLLAAFLAASPGPEALGPVVRALEDSPLQLPDLVCKLAETCVDAYQVEGGDISKAGSLVAADLSKIVIRLYAQTDDRLIQSRCLDLVDRMERHHFLGLSDELRRLDR